MLGQIKYTNLVNEQMRHGHRSFFMVAGRIDQLGQPVRCLFNAGVDNLLTVYHDVVDASHSAEERKQGDRQRVEITFVSVAHVLQGTNSKLLDSIKKGH